MYPSDNIKNAHAHMVAVLAAELPSVAKMLTQGHAPVRATQEQLVAEALRIMEKMQVTGLMHDNLMLYEDALQAKPVKVVACPTCPHKDRLKVERSRAN